MIFYSSKLECLYYPQNYRVIKPLDFCLILAIILQGAKKQNRKFFKHTVNHRSVLISNVITLSFIIFCLVCLEENVIILSRGLVISINVHKQYYVGKGLNAYLFDKKVCHYTQQSTLLYDKINIFFTHQFLNKVCI